jgi:hypothetical protein
MHVRFACVLAAGSGEWLEKGLLGERVQLGISLDMQQPKTNCPE